MVKVDIPFVKEQLDSSDPAGSLMAIVAIVVAMATFFVGSHYGRRIANTVTAAAPDGESEGFGLKGEL